VSPGQVEEALAETDSLAGAIARLQGGSGRTLKPLEPGTSAALLSPAVLSSSPVDLERPMEHSTLLVAALPSELREPAVRSAARAAVLLAVLLVASALWSWTDLRALAAPANLARLTEPLHDAPAGPLIVVAGFVIGSVFMLPVTVLILATILPSPSRRA
jgi:phospholipase D1/2